MTANISAITKPKPREPTGQLTSNRPSTTAATPNVIAQPHGLIAM